jgi:hypothetical protein
VRARNIKPGYYKNAELAECSIWARFLAPGLWMLADREGRLEDRPKQIKIEIFPCDNIDVDQLLDELATHEHIQRYEVGGKRFIQICKFKEHQRPHSNEVASIIPPINSALTDKETALSTKVQSASEKLESASSLTTDTLTTDSLNPESKKVSKQQRGSRFALTDLPEDWRVFCQGKRPDLDPDELFAEFKDFWAGVPGQRGCKLDWFATWRNRVRDKKRCSNGTDPPKTFRQIEDEEHAAAVEKARQRYVQSG